MIVNLSWQEIALAKKIGMQRQASNNGRGKADAYGFKGDGEAIHVQGAIAELAVAIALGKEWKAFCRTFELIKSDVGTKYQVRSTLHPKGNLILHVKDSNDQIYILARMVRVPEVDIVGWIKGVDGKAEKYWRPASKSFRHAAYLVPARDLLPIERLQL